jgi:hypothetical protein
MVTEPKPATKTVIRPDRYRAGRDLHISGGTKFKVYDSPLEPRHFTREQLKRAVDSARSLSTEE